MDSQGKFGGGGPSKRFPRLINHHGVFLDLLGSICPVSPLPSSLFPPPSSLFPLPSALFPSLPCFFALPCARGKLNQGGPKRPREDATKSNEGVKLRGLQIPLVSPFIFTLSLVVSNYPPRLLRSCCQIPGGVIENPFF